jgi:hypothetical protein
MKTIFDGNVRITTEEEDGNFTASIEFNGDGIMSSLVNREYAAIAELFTELKKLAIQKAKDIK